MDLSQSVGPCPVCRSCIYESTDMGFLVCEYGHQSQVIFPPHSHPPPGPASALTYAYNTCIFFETLDRLAGGTG